jgi:hypothetical protein
MILLQIKYRIPPGISFQIFFANSTYKLLFNLYYVQEINTTNFILTVHLNLTDSSVA